MGWRAMLCGSALAAGVCWPHGSKACSCADVRRPAEAFDRADAVFEGVVVEATEPFGFLPMSLRYKLPDSAGYPRFTFHVDRSWKGVTTTVVTLRSGYGGGDCGGWYEPRHRYLLFASAWEGELYHGICMRGEVDPPPSSELVRFLAPRSTLPLRAPQGLESRLPVVASAVACAALVLLAWLWLRRAAANGSR